MSKLAKFLLAVTAFAPVLWMYAVVSFLNSNYLYTAVFSVGSIPLVLICERLLNCAKNQLQSRKYYTTTIETADGEILSLLLIYLLPLITRNLATYNWLAWLAVTFFFCFVVTASYGYHLNPLLVIRGYHFYKVTEKNGISHILITKRRIYTSGENLRVVRLAEYVLIEKKKLPS